MAAKHQLTIRLEDSIFQRIKALAEVEGSSASAVVVSGALAEYARRFTSLDADKRELVRQLTARKLNGRT